MNIQDAISEIRTYMNSDSYLDGPSNDAAEIAIEALRLLEKKEQGLVVELPCRVGDTLYWIEDGELYDAKVLSYHFDEGAFWFEDDNGEEFTPDEFAERIGKTVFLTRAEAEAAKEG